MGQSFGAIILVDVNSLEKSRVRQRPIRNVCTSLTQFSEIALTKKPLNLQGGHIKIRLQVDMPVQVDGEPWLQAAGEVVVLKSALKVIFSYYFLIGSAIIEIHKKYFWTI